MADAPRLTIRPLRTDDPDEMIAFQDVYERAERSEFPDAPVYPLEDAYAVFTRTPLGQFYRGYSVLDAERDGRLVAEGMLMGNTADSVDRAQVFVWVAPEEQRRGIGSAVLEHLVDEARAMGRTVLQGYARVAFDHRDDHPVIGWAGSHGFHIGQTEVERHQRLPLDADLLDELAASVRPHLQGYRLRVVTGPIPAELSPSYCTVINRLPLDAPSGDLVVEKGGRTPEIVADQDVELVESKRTRVTAFALDEHGEVAGFSCAVVPESEPSIDQWATIVHPDHRGHRLGLAVKVELTRALQDGFPDKTFVSTENAEANAQMIAINEALGFEVYSLRHAFQRVLAD